MKSPIAPLTIALLGLGLAACGHASRDAGSASQASSSTAAPGRGAAGTTSPTTSTQPDLKKDSDEDNDNPTSSRYDSDDNLVVYYGHTANAADRQAITAVVKRYYAAAAAADGAKGCALMYSILAELVPEEYGQPPAPAALRGKTCATVMSKLFKQNRRQLAADVATLRVTLARVNGNGGLELLRFGPTERRVLVHREGGVWKIDTLLDIGVP